MADQVLGRLRGEITLESEGFKRGMNEVNAKLRLAKSEFDSSTARVKAFGKSQDELKLQAQALNKQLDIQEKKVELLQQRYAESVAETGEFSKQTQNAATALNRAKIAQTELEGALTRTTKAIQGASEPTKRLQRDIFAVRDEAIEAGFALGAMSIALGVAFGSTVVKAANFEAQLSSLKAVTNASAEDMAKLKNQALEMGKQTKFSAQEAAQAQEELAKAGLSTQQILSGGLKGALDLAAAGELDLAEAAEIASTALNTFKDDNLTVTRAADILAGSAISSATNVKQMNLALSQSSSVAAGAGLSFEDTATALSVFAANGLRSSDAGTSLKTMLLNLTPSSKEAADEMKNLGLITANGKNQFFDAAGHVKSFAEIAEVLKKQLGGLTDEQRNLALKTIFGTDAIRAANIAFLAGAEGVTAMNRALNKTTAAEVAKTRMDNLKGTVEELKGNFETLQIEMGTAFLPVLRNLAKGLSGVVDFFQKLSPSTKEALGVFTATTATVLGLGAAIAGIVAIANPFVGAVVGGAVAIGAISAAVTKVNRDMKETEENALRFGVGVSGGTVKAAKGFVDLRDQALVNLAKLRGATGAEAQKLVTETTAIFAQMGDKVTAALQQDKLAIQKAMAALLAEVPETLKPAVQEIERTAIANIDRQIKKVQEANKLIIKGITEFGGDVSKMPATLAKQFQEALRTTDESSRVFVQKIEDLNGFMSKMTADSGKITAQGAKKFKTDIEAAFKGATDAANKFKTDNIKIIDQAFAKGEIDQKARDFLVKGFETAAQERIKIATETKAKSLELLNQSLSEEAQLINLKTGEMAEAVKQFGKEFIPVPDQERKAQARAATQEFIEGVKSDYQGLTTKVNEGFNSMVGQASVMGLALKDVVRLDLSLEGLSTASSYAAGLREGSVTAEMVATQLGLDISSKAQIDLGSEGKFTVSTLIAGLQSGKVGVSTFIKGVDGLLKKGANINLTPEGSRTSGTFKSGLQSQAPAVSGAAKSLQDSVKRNLTFSASSIGSNVSSSMAGGIRSGQSNVINSAISVAKGALSAMKRALGIASPSKEFMRLGAWTTEGYAIGMEKKAGLVQNAANLLSVAATPNVAGLANASINTPSVPSSVVNNFVINNPVIRNDQDIYKLAAEINRINQLQQRAQGVVTVAY